MKKLNCNVKSNKPCQDCNKPMKQNYVDKFPDAELCYSCDPKSKKNRPGANPKSQRNLIEVNNAKG